MKTSYVLIALGIVATAFMASFFVPSQKKHLSDVSPTSPSLADSTKLVAQDAKKIYALGDSLTAGYQLPLEQSYPMQLEAFLEERGYNYSVVNGGKSGDTSAGLLARIGWLTEDAQPGDIALLAIGANDGLQSLPLEQLEENILNIVAFLQGKDMMVILCGMQLPTNLDPIYRGKFAALYKTIATQQQLSYISFLLEDVATIQALNLADGIHPNKAGYAVVAKNIYAFLVENDLITK